jgi:urease accessory protein
MPKDVAPDTAPGPTVGWQARLQLGFARERERTVMRERSHLGPLRVLKALYPEGDDVAHAVIVHPPGGVAAGDALAINLNVGPHAHALITTPGAQKWYGAHIGAHASAAQSDTNINIQEGATLEWLPHEAIVYDHARAKQTISFNIARGAKLIAWETLVWGRVAAGEAFRHGEFSQRIELRESEAIETASAEPPLMWLETLRVEGNAAMLKSPSGLGGYAAGGTVWIAGASDTNALLAHIRAAAEKGCEGIIFGATSPRAGLIVMKALAHDIEALRALFVRTWASARPAVCGRDAALPRLWAT